MSPQSLAQFEKIRISRARCNLILEACRQIQHFAMYLRMLYGEYLLYRLRPYAENPGVRDFFDGYAMAIQRAEPATAVMKRFRVMDEFYLDFLEFAFETQWLRNMLERLQKDGTTIMFVSFERVNGNPHLIFPTLTEFTTVKFDANTSRLIDDEEKGFSDEDLQRLNQALKHRVGIAYFDGLLAKDQHLAFSSIARFDPDRMAKWSAMHPPPPPPRSWLARLLDWLIPSRKAVA